MATEAQARVAFSTDVPDFQGKVPRAPFSVPTNVNAAGLSEVVSHLLRLSPPQFFSFLVVDDGRLLQSSIENYLIEHHKSSEHVLRLKFFPASRGPEPAASVPCPDWVSGISTAVPGHVVVACYNGAAEVRDSTGATTLAVCTGHRAPVKAVSACAQRGGFRMVTASKDHTVALWQGTSSSSSSADAQEENGSSSSPSLSSSSSSSSASSACTVVRVGTGHHLKSVDCVVMAGPERFFSGSWDGTVKLWAWPGSRAAAADDDDEQAPTKRMRKQGSSSSNGGGGAADGEGGEDGSTSSSATVHAVATLAGHTNQVSCLAVLEGRAGASAAAAADAATGTSSSAAGAAGGSRSPGRFVVSGSWDHSLRLWDVDRFVSLREINCGKVVNAVTAVGAAGNVFASAHPDNAVRVWDGRADAAGSVMQLALRGHQGWVSALAASPDNANELVSASYDGTLRVWDIRSTRPVHTVADAHDGKVLCVAWDATPKGRGIFSGGDDNQLNRFTV